MHRMHHKKTYQCNVKLPWKSIFLNDFCEIYEYQRYPTTSQSNSEDCPFCKLDSESRFITESATAFAIFDKYPVSDGHSLIIPKHHVSDYFDLTSREQSALWLMINRVKKKIDDKSKVMGFNIGVNVGQIAGQTVDHVHIHLIPRYTGDVEDPTGGVRNIIPGKGPY